MIGRVQQFLIYLLNSLGFSIDFVSLMNLAFLLGVECTCGTYGQPKIIIMPCQSCDSGVASLGWLMLSDVLLIKHLIWILGVCARIRDRVRGEREMVWGVGLQASSDIQMGCYVNYSIGSKGCIHTAIYSTSLMFPYLFISALYLSFHTL